MLRHNVFFVPFAFASHGNEQKLCHSHRQNVTSYCSFNFFDYFHLSGFFQPRAPDIACFKTEIECLSPFIEFFAAKRLKCHSGEGAKKMKHVSVRADPHTPPKCFFWPLPLLFHFLLMFYLKKKGKFSAGPPP